MKKAVALTLAVVLVLGIVSVALAESSTEIPAWFTEMIKWKKDKVDQAVKDGLITEEQANAYKERLEAMEKYHEENGFNFGNGFGSCMDGFGRRGGFGLRGGAGQRNFNNFKAAPTNL
ncbi:MAG: hypothetical protein HPY66_2349 [Firmicutes bacterium]|nr:hypothetical protein [Bacillota bacterium]